jgi:hypothetical protein
MRADLPRARGQAVHEQVQEPAGERDVVLRRYLGAPNGSASPTTPSIPTPPERLWDLSSRALTR